ncbi:MAG TPA: asparagine synthase (glutamine-hydrolyzing) [Beijerinckiaceae bacterium]|nr:asparagine synthase (glutamine-hydrolyzing) [Beijerinckiaceae bacterium]
MCGVLTVVSRDPVAAERLEAGLAALRHRGPDGTGTLVVPVETASGTASVGMAHARLAIIDPSPQAAQPFRRGDHVLCYNGEIYNHRELAAGLDGPLATASDTEVLLRLLAADGPGALARARGMWAFAWLDRARRRLVAARDRYGKKPLFYRVAPGEIVFASEVAGLRAATGRSFPIRDAALATFLAEGWCFPGADGATHLDGVREVRPGHALTLDLDGWTMREEPVAGLWPEGPADDLPGRLAAAVQDRLVSDRPLGLLLSGGVDSTLILAVLAATGGLDRVTCFTGEAGKSDDAAYARACVAATGARAVEIPLDYGPASLDHFLAVCRIQDKPFPLIGNVLGMPALYRAIAEHGVRVVLDGTGADEIFGGYWTRQAGFALRDAARAGDAAWLARLRDGGRVPDDLAALSDRDLCEKPLPTPSHPATGARERDWLSPDGADLLAQAPPGDPLVGFAGSLAAALRRDARAGRMQEWLWQNDRNAMAWGVENRSPFLDHRLAAWMETPYSAKFDGAENKRELRALFGRFAALPSAERTEKQGFRWVYGRFLRQNRERLHDLVLSSRTVRRLCRSDRLADDLRADPEACDRPLFHRLLVVAGLDAAGAGGLA